MSDITYQIGYFVILLAAVVYLWEKITNGFTKALARAFRPYIIALSNLKNQAEEDIKESFELWWTGGPQQTATRAARDKMFGRVGEVLPEVLNGAVEVMLEQILEPVRESALELAVHAYTQPKKAALLARIPRFAGLREVLARDYINNEEELDELRVSLLDYGVQPTEIETYFGLQSA